MILYQTGKGNRTYSEICKEFLAKLMQKDPKDKSKKQFIKNSVFRNIEEAINDSKYDKSIRQVLKELQKNKFKLLKRIICASPLDLEQMHTMEMVPLLEKANIYKNGSFISSMDYKEQILEIFNYKNLNKIIPGIWFQEELDIPICAYCNREKLSIIPRKSNSGKIGLMELDHFMPKALFPLFSISFYNLVVSCQNCNQKLKKPHITKPSTHIHPYIDSFHDEAYFDFKNSFIFSKKLVFKLSPKNIHSKANNTITDYRLDYVYQDYSDEINRFLIMYRKYHNPKHYQDAKFSKESGISIFSDKVDLETYIETTGIPRILDDIRRIPQGKLKFDYLQELNSHYLADE